MPRLSFSEVLSGGHGSSLGWTRQAPVNSKAIPAAGERAHSYRDLFPELGSAREYLALEREALRSMLLVSFPLGGFEGTMDGLEKLQDGILERDYPASVSEPPSPSRF